MIAWWFNHPVTAAVIVVAAGYGVCAVALLGFPKRRRRTTGSTVDFTGRVDR